MFKKQDQKQQVQAQAKAQTPQIPMVAPPQNQVTEPLPNPLPDAGQQKIEELTAALARAMADLQNYRRRTEEERGKWMRVAQADLLHDILPIIANLDRSLEHLPEELKINEWARGVLQIHSDWQKLMAKLGVKKIETVGKKIDPKFHAALMAVPGEKDVIVRELEAGYEWNNDVIFPAKVAVGNGEKPALNEVKG